MAQNHSTHKAPVFPLPTHPFQTKPHNNRQSRWSWWLSKHESLLINVQPAALHPSNMPNLPCHVSPSICWNLASSCPSRTRAFFISLDLTDSRLSAHFCSEAISSSLASILRRINGQMVHLGVLYQNHNPAPILGASATSTSRGSMSPNIPEGVLRYILFNQSTDLLEKLHGRLVLLILPHILLHTD